MHVMMLLTELGYLKKWKNLWGNPAATAQSLRMMVKVSLVLLPLPGEP